MCFDTAAGARWGSRSSRRCPAGKGWSRDLTSALPASEPPSAPPWAAVSLFHVLAPDAAFPPVPHSGKPRQPARLRPGSSVRSADPRPEEGKRGNAPRLFTPPVPCLPPCPQSVSPSRAGRGQAQVVTPGPPQPWPGNAVRTGSRSRFSKSLRRVTQKGALGVRADRPASFPHPLVFLTVCAVGKRESSRLPVNESRQARPSAVARSRCSRGEDAAAGGQSSGDGRGDGAVTRGAAWTGSIGRMNE